MEAIHLKHTPKLTNSTILLPGSKSESNRALILKALSQKDSEIINLSEARDTQTMIRLLESNDDILNVLDAGTTMRFLTAFMAIQNREVVLTGTKRMKKRPIGILVKSLNKIGCKITYEKKEGFPPLKIHPFCKQTKNEISIKGDQSSQFISALLMIAPCLPQGLKLKLKGDIGSKPYIQMTLDMMGKFGVGYQWTENIIEVPHQSYIKTTYTVESDWSGASYWYSLVALAEYAEVKLLGLKQNSLQGDIAIINIMNQLGVMSTFEEDGVLLKKIPHHNSFEYDFSDCPDLAQTVAVTCAAKHIMCKMTGLESLKIKETDRIKALKKELKKLHAKLKETSPGVWEIKSKYEANTAPVVIKTYEDHRMAMAFAPLAVLQDITILDPQVVSKSYPDFWNDLKSTGISTELISNADIETLV